MHRGILFIVVTYFNLATGRAFRSDAQHVLENSAASSSGTFGSPSSSLGNPDGITTIARTGFVALGDSYSAGIGTGVDGQEDDCRRGLHAHPQLIASDISTSHGGPSTTSFQFLSCTGAQTEEVLSGGDRSQIDGFNASLPADFALLSIGGNDLGFFEVVNACVFRFYNFYSGTCESALENARVQIESDGFENRLQIIILELLDKARWEKKPWFSITVTGYARFFNEATDACDQMSLGVWWNGPRLTKELRLRMNALVLAVNAKIRQTIDNVNSRFAADKVLFADYDDEFDGHRFCEENVTEPDYGRAETWFFLVGGQDNARNGTLPERRSDIETLASSSALVDPSSCLEAARSSGDWGELALCYMVLSKQSDPNLRPVRENIASTNSMWYVPTYYGKAFHPRSLGHETIRDKIYEAWRKFGV